MGKVIYYSNILLKLHSRTTQLSKKEYKRYLKLLQWMKKDSITLKQKLRILIKLMQARV